MGKVNVWEHALGVDVIALHGDDPNVELLKGKARQDINLCEKKERPKVERRGVSRALSQTVLLHT